MHLQRGREIEDGAVHCRRCL